MSLAPHWGLDWDGYLVGVTLAQTASGSESRHVWSESRFSPTLGKEGGGHSPPRVLVCIVIYMLYLFGSESREEIVERARPLDEKRGTSTVSRVTPMSEQAL